MSTKKKAAQTRAVRLDAETAARIEAIGRAIGGSLEFSFLLRLVIRHGLKRLEEDPRLVEAVRVLIDEGGGAVDFHRAARRTSAS